MPAWLVRGLVLLFSTSMALGQEQVQPKISELEQFSGDVFLCEGMTDAQAQNPQFDPGLPPPGVNCRKATKMGRRIKNGDIRNCDYVVTKAASTTTIVFPDRSRFEVKENTRVQYKANALPRPTPEGWTIGRRIRTWFGRVVDLVVPSQYKNDFETPSGSSADRGTVLSTGTDPATAVDSVAVYQGQVETLVNALTGQAFLLTGGTGAAALVYNAAGILEGPRALNSLEIQEIEAALKDPAAWFTASPEIVPVGREVQFVDGSVPGLFAPIVAYAWGFGDGVSSSQTNPKHAFASVGQFEVSLTVTDGNGRTSTFAREVTVLSSIPALSTRGMAVLVALLAVVGFILLRRQRLIVT